MKQVKRHHQVKDIGILEFSLEPQNISNPKVSIIIMAWKNKRDTSWYRGVAAAFTGKAI